MPVAGRREVEISSANKLGNQRDAMRSRLQAGEFHVGHQAIEASENEPINVAEDKALRRFTPKHIHLMAKNENFGLQRRAGPEQPGHEAPKQPEEVDHRTQYHPIRSYRPAILGLR